MSITYRLKELRTGKKITQEELCKDTGLKLGTYRNYEQGAREMNGETLVMFAKYYGVSTDYILGRVEEKRINSIRIPVLGRVPAGTPIEAIEDIIDWEELSPNDYNPNYEYFGLVVIGESMSPKYMDGDTIIVQRVEDADSGSDVVAYVNGQDATLKRLTKNTNGAVSLSPLNPAYQVLSFSPEDIHKIPVKILGIVKEIRRKV